MAQPRSEVLRQFADDLEAYAADLRAISYYNPDDVDESDVKFRGVLDLTVSAQEEYMKGGQ